MTRVPWFRSFSYRAFDEVNGTEVAWNQAMLCDMMRSPEALERMYSEVHLLSSLCHESIIKFHSSWIDVEHRTFNFITELFASGTLRQYAFLTPPVISCQFDSDLVDLTRGRWLAQWSKVEPSEVTWKMGSLSVCGHSVWAEPCCRYSFDHLTLLVSDKFWLNRFPIFVVWNLFTWCIYRKDSRFIFQLNKKWFIYRSKK